MLFLKSYKCLYEKKRRLWAGLGIFLNKRPNKENAKFHFIEFGNDFTLSKTSAIV